MTDRLPSPQDSPDVQEALSSRYVSGVQVVALSSGRFALFAPGKSRELVMIVDTLREEVLRDLCLEAERGYELELEEQANASLVAKTTLEELDL